jgi:hypothetical protein
MTVVQARAILSNTGARLSDVTEAAAVIARTKASTLDDLFNCLDRGGLAAEFAAMELYRRAEQSPPSDPTLFITSRDRWSSHFSADHAFHKAAANSDVTGRIGFDRRVKQAK